MLDDLVEAIPLTVLRKLTRQANPKATASGTVLEAQTERAGTTVLVQNGTLHPWTIFPVGDHHGRVKAMYDYTAGASRKLAHRRAGRPWPGTAFLVAGEQFRWWKARKVATRRRSTRRSSGASRRHRAASRPPWMKVPLARLQEGETKTLNLYRYGWTSAGRWSQSSTPLGPTPEWRERSSGKPARGHWADHGELTSALAFGRRQIIFWASTWWPPDCNSAAVEEACRFALHPPRMTDQYLMK